jgi:hypothetical protein
MLLGRCGIFEPVGRGKRVCFRAFAFQGLDTRFSSYEMDEFCL